MHENKHFTSKQKEILYRILFKFTPTSEGFAKLRNIQQNCKLCNTHQETEEHIYFECTTIKQTKMSLLKLLRLPTNTNRGLYQLIFLGKTTQNSDKNIKQYRQTLAQIYRDTIWRARIGAKWDKQQVTDNALNDTFKAKAHEYIQLHVELHTLNKL